MDNNYLNDLFISEAKAALNSQGGGVSADQIEAAVTDYLDKNPVDPATATIENGILKVT